MMNTEHLEEDLMGGWHKRLKCKGLESWYPNTEIPKLQDYSESLKY